LRKVAPNTKHQTWLLYCVNRCASYWRVARRVFPIHATRVVV
jgi:hypothetical protein